MTDPMLRIAYATLGLCFVLPAVVSAVSDGHFDTARQGCEKSDYTYDQKDVDHPDDGCETITLQIGPAESNDFLRAGVDHEREGVGPHSGSIKAGPSESNADDSTRVVTADWNSGYAVTGPRTLSPGGPPMISQEDDPAIDPSVRPENAALDAPDRPADWSLYFGMDDNWIFGEHHSTSQAEPGFEEHATGPVSGGGWDLETHPDTASPEGNLDASDRREPLRAADGGFGFCADGICAAGRAKETTVYQGGDSGEPDRPAYVHSGNPANSNEQPAGPDDTEICNFRSPSQACKDRRENQGRVYVPWGITLYQDPNPDAPERFGPELWEYPMPSSHIGAEGVRVLDATIVDLRPRSNSAAPLNIGHRGTGTNTAENPYPENTLASFVHAVEFEGADGIELDVQLALNNGNADPFDELVLMHDESLNRTTTCRSSLPLDDCVSTRTPDDIRASCVPLNGSGETERPTVFAEQVVPTLREALDAIVRDRGKFVNIEIKNQPPTDTDSQRELCNSGEPLNVSSLLTDLLLAEYTPAERALVFISSFNPFAAAAAKHESTLLGAPVDVGLLVIPLRDAAGPQFPDATYAALFAAAVGLDAIHPNEQEATAEAVGFAQSLGLAVRPWTVNERCGIRRLIDLGVDAIITDEPDRLAAELVTPSTCP